MFKLPVENVVGFTIGDIYVDVNINFRPVAPPETMEKIAIDSFNARLGEIAWEVKTEVKKIIENKLESK